MTKLRAGFLMEAVTLSLDQILPSRKLKGGVETSKRYQMIAASVREVGIIEPLVVTPQSGKRGMYLLLDGHVRLEILRELGRESVTCLVSTDDENSTYNIRVSRLAPIQENRMILKAIAEGVSEEKLAKALNVSPKTIRNSRTELDNICPQALETLKDKPVSSLAIRVLKQVKPYRQIEMADLMTMSNTYSAPYVRALLAATPAEQLAKPPKTNGKPEQIAKIETELRAVERDFVVLDESYGQDTLNLQLARTYVKTLLQNPRVARYIGQKHTELLEPLQKVVEASSLEGA